MIERPAPVHLAPSTVFFAAATLVGLVCAVLLALNLISVLVTVFLAILLAETIRPPVVALERRGVPRGFAILAIYLAVVVVLAGSLVLLIPPFTQQVTGLVREAPGYLQALREQNPAIDQAMRDLRVEAQLQELLPTLAGQLTPMLRTIAALPVQVLAAIIAVLSGFVLAVFWIGLTEAADRNVVSRLPVEQRIAVRTLAGDLSQTLGGWLRGQLVLMVFVGALAFAGLVVLGIPYPVALAVWAGVTELFPIIGPWVGGVPAVIIALVISPTHALVVFVMYLAIQQIENNLLVPKVMQRAVGLHPFFVLVGLLFGGSLMGIPGIIISVPVAAAVQVLVSRLWLNRVVGPASTQASASLEETLARVPPERPPELPR